MYIYIMYVYIYIIYIYILYIYILCIYIYIYHYLQLPIKVLLTLLAKSHDTPGRVGVIPSGSVRFRLGVRV